MFVFKKTLSVLTVCAVAACAAAVSPAVADAAVIVEDGDFQYTYSNGAWQIFKYTGTADSLTLPSRFEGAPVNGVCNECFSNSGVAQVTIPEGYTSIGNYAFYNCESLHTVTLPGTMAEIGMGAFAESGVTGIDLSNTKVEYINPYLFKSCASLSSVELPDSAVFIGEAAFAESGVESVTIPENVTTLDRAAFANTESLQAVAFSRGLKSIGESCFENSALNDVVLPEGLESVGASAFRGNSSLETMYIPDSVTQIGAYALFPMSVQATLEVTCFKDSYADVYCYENFVLKTVSVYKIPGDTNLDGVVNINDVTAAQRHCADLELLSTAGRVNADVTRDDDVTIDDATRIQRFLAEYDESL